MVKNIMFKTVKWKRAWHIQGTERRSVELAGVETGTEDRKG